MKLINWEKEITQLNDMRKYSPQEDIRPYARLLIAILCRTALDIIGNKSVHPHTKREARVWLDSPDDEPFSFMWICSFLSVDPVRIRKNILVFASQSEYPVLRGTGANTTTLIGVDGLTELLDSDMSANWIYFH